MLGHVLAIERGLDQAKAAFETALRLNPSSFSILVYYVGWASTFGEPERGALLADRAIRLNPSYRPWASGFLRYAYFMAGRYKDALQVMERQTPDNYTQARLGAAGGELRHAGAIGGSTATLNEALKRHPALTIEGFVSDPSFNDTEREHMIRTMRTAGFPACAKPEALARFAQPVRLPECTKS